MFNKVGHGEQAIVGFVKDANASEQFLRFGAIMNFCLATSHVMFIFLNKILFKFDAFFKQNLIGNDVPRVRFIPKPCNR